ncbi:NUDIX hydrolase [Actinospica robiniae]|uniref:NUDIX hydrolase n=1 Tax=Actinospica robiniae TaxID=304901 RepID=UPI000400AA0D|nr:CoA pyrophosphatase [Actinospica robiniae]
MPMPSPGDVQFADPDALPGWLSPLARATQEVATEADWMDRPQLRRSASKPGEPRRSAVLLLFGEGLPHGPDMLITERAATLRAHAGQAAFPGGRLDPADGDPHGEGRIRAALREAQEETGVDPAGVSVFGVLPELYLPPSDFLVTPVLAWWRSPAPLLAGSPSEVARVCRVPLADLVDPANRIRVRHSSGFNGPAFVVGELLVWGFTAGVLDAVLRLGGWARDWDEKAAAFDLPLDLREFRSAHGPA